MDSIRFLDQIDNRNAILNYATEAAEVMAPSEADLVEVIAEEYFHQVKKAGRVLYPIKSRGRPLGVGAPELVVGAVVAVVTGFLGNLLSEAAVGSYVKIKSKKEQIQASPGMATMPQLPIYRQDQVNSWAKSQMQAAGFSSKQMDQLLPFLIKMASELMVTGNQREQENGR